MPIEPSFDNALAFAQDLIRIPSPSGQEGAVAKRLREEMEALGYDEIDVDGVGNVIGLIRGASGGAPVMLNCHMDVVAEGDHEAWEHPPFGGVVADGFLHGRGSMDIKGPLALQTYTGAGLKGRAPGDVIVAHTVFEERGGWGMEHLLRSGRVQPQAVIIGEATRGDITTGHRGRAEVEVVARGVAGHASAPGRARNALDLVPPILAALEDLAGKQPSDPVLGPATLVATTIDIRPESRNVIPDEAVVVADWRVLPGATDQDLLRQVEEALDRHLPGSAQGGGTEEAPGVEAGGAVEVRMAREDHTAYTGLGDYRDLYTPGFLMAEGDPLIQAAARAVGRREGKGPARIRPWTFATDGGWSSGVFGIPTLGFAPGEERFAHTNRERLDVEEARWAYGRQEELVLAVQAALSS